MENENQTSAQDAYVIEQLGVENVNLKIENARLRFLIQQLSNQGQESQES